MERLLILSGKGVAFGGKVMYNIENSSGGASYEPIC